MLCYFPSRATSTAQGVNIPSFAKITWETTSTSINGEERRRPYFKLHEPFCRGNGLPFKRRLVGPELAKSMEINFSILAIKYVTAPQRPSAPAPQRPSAPAPQGAPSFDHKPLTLRRSRRFSTSLTKDEVFTGLRDMIQRIGQVLSQGTPTSLQFHIGKLVAKERKVAMLFDMARFREVRVTHVAHVTHLHALTQFRPP